MLPTITVRELQENNKKALQDKWQELELSADNSVFLSWLWIESWLTVVTDNLFIIEATFNNKTVGLGIFFESKRYSLGLFPIKQWWLHKTGEQNKDQIWIEHNDFLLDKSLATTIRQAMVSYIYNNEANVTEVIIGLSDSTVQNSFEILFPENRTEVNSLGHLVDYSQISNSYFDEILSKNTRYQVNRSKKLLAEQGELNFNIVDNSKDIIALLPNISALHQERWQHSSEGSGFSNPIFTQFHQHMIKKDNSATIQVAVLSLNNRAIGYLLNYIYKDKVSFYLSALSNEFSNKIKVGILLHAEAIDYYQKQNLLSYDFLAGDAQYKRSLATAKYQLALKYFHRPHIALTIEKSLRFLKAKLHSIR